MAKYRNKLNHSEIIEAWQFKTEGLPITFMGYPVKVDGDKNIYVEIPTLDKNIKMNWGDWYIQGGILELIEFMIVKEKYFEETYELIE